MRIQKIGKVYAERLIVIDDFEHVWTPLGWMPDWRDALVFADRSRGEKVIRVLSKQQKEIEDGHKYVVEIVVTISPDHWVSLDDLRETLRRHVGVINQIEGDFLILGVEINWESLKEAVDE